MSSTKFDWYVSDTHFSHDNILKFEGQARPFTTIEEHDEELIRRWNERVAPHESVLHLGDVAFKPATTLDRIMPRLHGLKTLVMGNHDISQIERYREYFNIVPCVQDKQNGILFTHFPVHPCDLEHRYKVNVHGHLHSKIIPDKRYINISCEHTDLAPLSRDGLWKRILQC